MIHRAYPEEPGRSLQTLDRLLIWRFPFPFLRGFVGVCM
jgi:hypothetical protein